jgi:hypothetical protein
LKPDEKRPKKHQKRMFGGLFGEVKKNMTSTIRKYLLVTLSHAEKYGHYSPKFVAAKIRSIFFCKVVIVSRELILFYLIYERSLYNIYYFEKNVLF